jgi:hypothetical protein
MPDLRALDEHRVARLDELVDRRRQLLEHAESHVELGADRLRPRHGCRVEGDILVNTVLRAMAGNGGEIQFLQVLEQALQARCVSAHRSSFEGVLRTERVEGAIFVLTSSSGKKSGVIHTKGEPT